MQNHKEALDGISQDNPTLQSEDFEEIDSIGNNIQEGDNGDNTAGKKSIVNPSYNIIHFSLEIFIECLHHV